MGAREQENATESGDSVASLRVLCEERDPKAKGAKGFDSSAQREGSSSPLTTPEAGVSAPEGAKKGASISRTEWGLSEDLLAVGYAQCAGGVA